VQASSTPPRSIALVALGLLLLGALVGALALDDYGLGFDENTQRLKIGRVNWNYLTGADRQTLPVSVERH
jgi:hypothetical protein